MIISAEDKKRLLEVIPEAKKAIEDDDIELLLEIVDDFVCDDIMDHDDEPSEIGYEFENIYDRLNWDNPCEE